MCDDDDEVVRRMQGEVEDDEGEAEPTTMASDAAGAHPIRRLMTSSPHPTRDYLHTLLIRVQGL